MKILLPVDGSKYTKRMLRYLASHNEFLGAAHDHTMFTAVPVIPARIAIFMSRSAIDDYYRDQAEDVLRPARAFSKQHGWKVREVHVNGAAGQLIAEQAKAQKFDLIVMGTHGRSAIGTLILGSVASVVLALSKVPVLLIR